MFFYVKHLKMLTLLKQLLPNCFVLVGSFARIRQYCLALKSHLDLSMYLESIYYCTLERWLQQSTSKTQALNNFSKVDSSLVPGNECAHQSEDCLVHCMSGCIKTGNTFCNMAFLLICETPCTFGCVPSR